MADETTPPPPTTSPGGFFSKPPQRPGTVPPMRSVAPPPLAPTPEPRTTADAEPPGDTEPHPWMRYFARTIDIVLFSMGAGLVSGIMLPLLGRFVNVALLLILVISMWVFGWIFIESALLATWGTTPGKWLFGLTLRTARGTKLDFPTALRRTLKVWVRGLALGLPIVSLIALVIAYNRLKEKGETSWDAEGGFQVTRRSW